MVSPSKDWGNRGGGCAGSGCPAFRPFSTLPTRGLRTSETTHHPRPRRNPIRFQFLPPAVQYRFGRSKAAQQRMDRAVAEAPHEREAQHR